MNLIIKSLADCKQATRPVVIESHENDDDDEDEESDHPQLIGLEDNVTEGYVSGGAMFVDDDFHEKHDDLLKESAHQLDEDDDGDDYGDDGDGDNNPNNGRSDNGHVDERKSKATVSKTVLSLPPPPFLPPPIPLPPPSAVTSVVMATAPSPSAAKTMTSVSAIPLPNTMPTPIGTTTINSAATNSNPSNATPSAKDFFKRKASLNPSTLPPESSTGSSLINDLDAIVTSPAAKLAKMKK